MVTRRMQRILGLAVIAIAVAMGAEYAVQTAHERHLVQCQARVNDAFSRVLKLRGDLSDADRSANRRLLEAITRAKTADDIRRAEQAYLRTQEQLDQQRRTHPYPELPSRACS